MADFNLTASAASAIQKPGSDIFTKESYVLALERGLDKVFKREYETPFQGERYFGTASMKQPTETYQSFLTLGGVVGQNRDADDIPYVTSGEGFRYSVSSYLYRIGIAIERELQEIDDRGVTRGKQAEMARMARMTREYAYADVFNRAVNPTNAPLLCDDGMYLIDSDRPNANPEGGTWSNEEAASAITPTSLWTAGVNARKIRDDNGELIGGIKIMKIIAGPDYEKTLKEILGSDKNPTNAMNTVNILKGYAPYEIYDYLTDAAIFYQLCDAKSEENELKCYWRQKDSFKTWEDGSNPDIMRQRVRFAFGLGCGSPRRAWRGGEIS